MRRPSGRRRQVQIKVRSRATRRGRPGRGPASRRKRIAAPACAGFSKVNNPPLKTIGRPEIFCTGRANGAPPEKLRMRTSGITALRGKSRAGVRLPRTVLRFCGGGRFCGRGFTAAGLRGYGCGFARPRAENCGPRVLRPRRVLRGRAGRRVFPAGFRGGGGRPFPGRRGVSGSLTERRAAARRTARRAYFPSWRERQRTAGRDAGRTAARRLW